jgi:hypothetical protein
MGQAFLCPQSNQFLPPDRLEERSEDVFVLYEYGFATEVVGATDALGIAATVALGAVSADFSGVIEGLTKEKEDVGAEEGDPGIEGRELLVGINASLWNGPAFTNANNITTMERIAKVPTTR